MTSKIEMYLFVFIQTKTKIKNKQTKKQKQKQKNTQKQNTEYNSHCNDFKKGWGGFFHFLTLSSLLKVKKACI